MQKIRDLKPKMVWHYFDEITRIPRPSKKEEKIITYLKAFGKTHKLETHVDKVGNVLIRKAPTKGLENLKITILQSHMDMVCEKNNDVVFDFENTPIKATIVGGNVTAEGTTLGADDGIGVAAQLALLAASDIAHGPIECLFTVDEETGLTGAYALEPDFLEGEILLNLDSEDDGKLFIGCAGGVDSIATFKIESEEIDKKSNAFKLSVKGLKGGHSGDKIDKAKGNSNKLLSRFLWDLQGELKFGLARFDGGNLRNAIPREAFVIVTVLHKDVNELKNAYQTYTKTIKSQYAIAEPKMELSIEPAELPETVLKKELCQNLLDALYACPHGVFAWSDSIPGLVETSTNLASVKFEHKHIVVTTSQRSSLEAGKNDIAAMVHSVFRLAGAEVRQTDGYPGWTPNLNSEIMNITKNSYTKLFGNEPKVKAIHAGLECGLFLEKYPKLDMVSFGPTVRGAHSPDEYIVIETVDKFWRHLLDILTQIPAKQS